MLRQVGEPRPGRVAWGQGSYPAAIWRRSRQIAAGESSFASCTWGCASLAAARSLTPGLAYNQSPQPDAIQVLAGIVRLPEQVLAYDAPTHRRLPEHLDHLTEQIH